MRILIRRKAIVRKFMVLESSDRDGSVTLVVRREGSNTSATSWSTRSAGSIPTERSFQKPIPKSKRVTIHQSGCVNYHENGRKIFIGPLTRITALVPIYGYRVPCLDRLDLHQSEVEKGDVVFDLSDLDSGPTSFSVLIGPKDLALPGQGLKLTHEAEGYALFISLERIPFEVPGDYECQFTTFTPEVGAFGRQQMTEEQALLAYHQAITGSTGLILYRPNGEGVIRLIFSVPMRVAPNFRVKLVDPELQVIEQDVSRERRSEKVMLKFKVRNRRTHEVIREEVAIHSIELDARL